MTPFEPTPDNRPLSNGPSSISSNHIMHLGVLTTAWHAVSIDANFMRWFGPKWRYLKVCIAHEKVSTGKLLSIEPLEPNFQGENNKLKKYRVHPNTRIVLPRSTCDVIVTMRAQKEASSYLHCKDKFLLQSVVVITDTSQTDIIADMFNKDSGHIIEECKLKVVYISHPQPPSPVPDGSEDGPSPKGPSTDNSNRHANGLKGKILFYVVRSLLMVRRPPLLLW
ncbi:Vesicle-associated protein 1-1 [Vitis vinifera]|uniref:Vesicle-associated protein 1-1 n=1 Tax=Vitis vinifera TaxID=29760 RepID=A0A438IC55_VITVI|nr:Vesicle-associated protein 1-1 [Vitis vinifera]